MTTTQNTFDPGTSVRPVEWVYAEFDDGGYRWLTTGMLLTVLSQTGELVKALNDITGRRCVLPADKLTRVGG